MWRAKEVRSGFMNHMTSGFVSSCSIHNFDLFCPVQHRGGASAEISGRVRTDLLTFSFDLTSPVMFFIRSDRFRRRSDPKNYHLGVHFGLRNGVGELAEREKSSTRSRVGVVYAPMC